jgi:hypothetical protein
LAAITELDLIEIVAIDCLLGIRIYPLEHLSLVDLDAVLLRSSAHFPALVHEGHLHTRFSLIDFEFVLPIAGHLLEILVSDVILGSQK